MTVEGLALPLERVSSALRSSRQSTSRSSIHSSRSIQRLSESRRKKLQSLQDREALKGRRARLQAMLIQKLVQKYGQKNGQKSRCIEKLVKSFVDKTDTVTEESLIKLEDNVRDTLKNLPASSSTTNLTSARGDRNLESSTSLPQINTARTNQPEDTPAENMPAGLLNEWTLLDMVKSIENEEFLKNEALRLHERKKVFKAELDKQMKVQQEKDQVEVDEDLKYAKYQNDMITKWKSAQEITKKKKHDKLQEEKAIRLAQIADRENLKKLEIQERLEREKKEIEAVKRELKRQEELQLDKKKEERLRLLEQEEENKKERLRRSKRAAEEAEEDVRLMMAHKEKLEREELARATAFKERMDKIYQQGQKWANEGAGKKKADDERKLELIILKEAAKKEAADAERERRDKEARRNNSIKMQEENKKIMEERKRLEELERLEEQKYAQQFRKEGEDYTKAEKERRRAIREKQNKQSQILLNQMEEAESFRRAAIMSEAEKKINHSVLSRLQNDNAMLAKIQEKLCAPMLAAKKTERPSPLGYGA